MRRRYLVVLALFAGLCLFAGGQQEAGSAESAEPIVLKMAYTMPPVGSIQEAIEKFAELVEQKTEGEVVVKLFPNGSLGNDTELVEGLAFGSTDIHIGGFAPYMEIAPEYGALEAPFNYRDYDHMLKVLNGEVGQDFKDALLERKNLKVFSFFPRGPRMLTSNKKIPNIDALQGVKLRVPPLPVYMEPWKLLGANTTPVDYSELYMALKQGVVEGQENPLATIDALKMSGVQKYVMNTQHMMNAFTMSMDNDRFNELSNEHQTAISEAAEEAAELELTLMLQNEQALKEKLESEGMEFIEIEDMEAFRAPVVANLPDIFADKWAPGLWDRIQQVK